jgi:hypothetical protein
MLKQNQAAVRGASATGRGDIVEQGGSEDASRPPNLRDANVVVAPAELLGGGLEDAK